MLARNTWYWRLMRARRPEGSAEIAGGVHRNAGRDRAEQHQEEPRERIDPEMKRQVGQPERQSQRLRGKPYRLKAEGGEHEAGERAERKSEPPGERRVVRRSQSECCDDKPENCDDQRACE